MDLCSPWVVIRLLAAVGISLFAMGMWLVGVAGSRELLVDQYNSYVREWSNIYYTEFSRASFVLELGLAVTSASVHHYPLDGDHGVEDENMIPPGYYPDLEQYTPLQYISDQIIAENVVRSTNKIPPLPAGKAMEAHINVTLVAKTRVTSSGGNITLNTQRMPVGSFQMYGEWPASQHLCEGFTHDSGQSKTADGACHVLRAVRSLCLVVSWKGSTEGWDWRSSGNGGKGCYGVDRKRGWGDWVLANDLADMHGDASMLVGWQEGRFEFGAGVFEEHDPFLMIQNGGKLETLMSSPELEADACLICGSILVTIFVVHWTVCEKMDDGELDRELTRILIATGAAPAPPDRATADRIFRRRRERERRRAAAQAAERADAEAEAEAARVLARRMEQPHAPEDDAEGGGAGRARRTRDEDEDEDEQQRQGGGGGGGGGGAGGARGMTPEQRLVAQGSAESDEDQGATPRRRQAAGGGGGGGGRSLSSSVDVTSVDMSVDASLNSLRSSSGDAPRSESSASAATDGR